MPKPECVLGNFELPGYPYKLIRIKNLKSSNFGPDCDDCELSHNKDTFSELRHCACNEYPCITTNSFVIQEDNLAKYIAEVVAKKLNS